MNALLGTTYFAPESLTPAALGSRLFAASQHREVALSDAAGCADWLRMSRPDLPRPHARAARRIAIDLQGRAARDAARFLFDCRTALAQAEKAVRDGVLPRQALMDLTTALAAALGASGVVRP